MHTGRLTSSEDENEEEEEEEEDGHTLAAGSNKRPTEAEIEMGEQTDE